MKLRHRLSIYLLREYVYVFYNLTFRFISGSLHCSKAEPDQFLPQGKWLSSLAPLVRSAQP